MPIADAPRWKMPKCCVAAVTQVAPAQRTLMAGLVRSLELEGINNANDRISFLSEVLAAQFNLMVDMMAERRAEVAPSRPALRESLEEIALADMSGRARMRKIRGDD
jgi:hypothetical protein